jgi:hypothetical protein
MALDRLDASIVTDHELCTNWPIIGLHAPEQAIRGLGPGTSTRYAVSKRAWMRVDPKVSNHIPRLPSVTAYRAFHCRYTPDNNP